MVSVSQVEGEFSFIKQNSSPEQSKCHQGPLSGIRTHVYWLGIPAEGDGLSMAFSCSPEEGQSLLDALLLSQWEDHAWKGQLGYDITTCEMKFISGQKKFTTQLNERWNSNFLSEFENKALQSLGLIKPSCVKALRENVLFCVAYGEKENSEIVSLTMLPKNGILVIVNVNPVEYGHVFLVPYDVHQLPQSLDKKMLGLITQIAVEINNCSFHIFFDHCTSTNAGHMYFQASYFANPLPVELLPTIPVYGDLLTTEICVYEVADYPLKTLVFIGKNLEALLELVAEISVTLRNHDTAFSLLISECGKTIFLFPQVYTALTGCHLYAWECGGYFVYDTKSEFNRISETEISERMSSVSLDDSNFQALKQLCCSVAIKLAH